MLTWQQKNSIHEAILEWCAAPIFLIVLLVSCFVVGYVIMLDIWAKVRGYK